MLRDTRLRNGCHAAPGKMEVSPGMEMYEESDASQAYSLRYEMQMYKVGILRRSRLSHRLSPKT